MDYDTSPPLPCMTGVIWYIAGRFSNIRKVLSHLNSIESGMEQTLPLCGTRNPSSTDNINCRTFFQRFCDVVGNRIIHDVNFSLTCHLSARCLDSFFLFTFLRVCSDLHLSLPNATHGSCHKTCLNQNRFHFKFRSMIFRKQSRYTTMKSLSLFQESNCTSLISFQVRNGNLTQAIYFFWTQDSQHENKFTFVPSRQINNCVPHKANICSSF